MSRSRSAFAWARLRGELCHLLGLSLEIFSVERGQLFAKGGEAPGGFGAGLGQVSAEGLVRLPQSGMLCVERALRLVRFRRLRQPLFGLEFGFLQLRLELRLGGGEILASSFAPSSSMASESRSTWSWARMDAAAWASASDPWSCCAFSPAESRSSRAATSSCSRSSPWRAAAEARRSSWRALHPARRPPSRRQRRAPAPAERSVPAQTWRAPAVRPGTAQPGAGSPHGSTALR